jgi:hypothetical protein
MKCRFIVQFSLLAMVCAAATLAPELMAQSASGTNAGAGSSSWKVSRTAWGDPDLQGMWSYATLTPLERPASVKDREFFTAEEAATRDAQSLEDRPPAPGDTGAYNAHWFDRGKVLTDRRTSLIVDPPDGRLPLTAEGRKRVAERAESRKLRPADSWLDRTNWDRCITYHGVPPISTGYNNTYQIMQIPGYVVILAEMIHDARVVPVDGRPRLSENIRQWNGSSRGRWEGNTLVVETANFSDQTENRFPSSRHTRAIERFTRVSQDMIDYRFTVEDPVMYTRPWTAVRPMPRLKDYVMYEYACHEGNYAMPNILSGQRTIERRRAEATANQQSQR